ncbi:MAG: M1 family metallopeptidase [Deltaproteobacteria bacterium]|nr:M1 family metallopeptidase [Deltaproteobacteria bacterium]
MAERERVLLPDDVSPKRYDLTLKPDLERFAFSGSEAVEIEIKAPTRRVVLHATELEIHSAALERDGATLEPVSIEANEEEETVAFVFGETLDPGPARLAIEFTGLLNDKMHGFYRGVYHQDGEKRTMAVTQFEATDARRAFPCWDEPAQKAVFAVTLVVPEDRVAVSNMPPTDVETGDDGLKTVRFADTPVMSTYLLAFVVGEFDYVETETTEGVTVRVYTPVGRREQGRFALDVAARTLSFFDEYFGIAYPLPKMDLLAIPDFAAGAMENWGAVTYRETAILVDPEESSAGTRQRVAIIVAHELAHQWFGNLVTMEWWTHLWLNEGFASWIEFLAVDHMFPEWDMWTQFVYSDFGRALSLDGLKSSHPIEIEVRDPKQISEIFDGISYSKGASVIRMLAAYLGADTFRSGLRRYLERHQYANATTEDLWQALAEESGKPVKQIMDTWTKQTGYPLLSVNMKQGEVELHQTRFFLSGVPDRDDTSRWSVPLGIRTEGGQDTFRVFEEERTTVDSGSGRREWLKVNPDQTGFYRSNYSAELWDRLAAAVGAGELPSATDRLGLQNDAFALARAGYLDPGRPLALASSYRNETDYTVWADLSENLRAYDILLSHRSCHESFRAYARSLYQTIHTSLGWDARPGESHLTKLLRPMVIGLLGRYGDPQVNAEALRRFDEGIRDATPVAPDLRMAVYGQVVESRGLEGYEAVLRVYREAELHEEKNRCLRALGCSTDLDLLRRTLDFSLSDEVRGQDTPLAVAGVAMNPLGRDLAWNFLREKWAEFDDRYGQGGFIIARIVSITTEDFTTLEKAAEVESFFESHPAPAATRTVRQSLERIRSNALWLERDGDAIAGWLDAYEPAP